MTFPRRVRIRRSRGDLLTRLVAPERAMPEEPDSISPGPTPDGRLAVFMLEQVMPGLTPADIDAVQRAVADATRRVTLEGLPVRCVRRSYVPSEHRWICLFVSRSVKSVRRIADLAQLTSPRITEVMVLGPQSPQRTPGLRDHGLRVAW